MYCSSSYANIANGNDPSKEVTVDNILEDDISDSAIKDIHSDNTMAPVDTIDTDIATVKDSKSVNNTYSNADTVKDHNDGVQAQSKPTPNSADSPINSDTEIPDDNNAINSEILEDVNADTENAHTELLGIVIANHVITSTEFTVTNNDVPGLINIDNDILGSSHPVNENIGSSHTINVIPGVKFDRYTLSQVLSEY